MNEKQVNDIGKRKKLENSIHGMTNISFLLLVFEMTENVVTSRIHPCLHFDSCQQNLLKNLSPLAFVKILRKFIPWSLYLALEQECQQ